MLATQPFQDTTIPTGDEVGATTRQEATVIDAIDIRKTTLSLKADERMIAFAGFLIMPEKDGRGKEGVLKISAFHRPDGTGYLTLTFIVDTKDDQATREYLARVFKKFNETSVKPFFGREMTAFVKVPLDFVTGTEEWYVEELNLYFRSLQGQERHLIENRLVPGLATNLPFSFDPLEWWPKGRPQQKASNLLARQDSPIDVSLKALFRKWFGSGGH